MARVPDRVTAREAQLDKPLPDQNRRELPAPLYNDPPLLGQRPPEASAFVNAYRQVGRPRIVVFVNRTLAGELLPVNEDRPVIGIERRAQATTGVNVESRYSSNRTGYYRNDSREQTDRLQ